MSASYIKKSNAIISADDDDYDNAIANGNDDKRSLNPFGLVLEYHHHDDNDEISHTAQFSEDLFFLSLSFSLVAADTNVTFWLKVEVGDGDEHVP